MPWITPEERSGDRAFECPAMPIKFDSFLPMPKRGRATHGPAIQNGPFVVRRECANSTDRSVLVYKRNIIHNMLVRAAGGGSLYPDYMIRQARIPSAPRATRLSPVEELPLSPRAAGAGERGVESRFFLSREFGQPGHDRLEPCDSSPATRCSCLGQSCHSTVQCSAFSVTRCLRLLRVANHLARALPLQFSPENSIFHGRQWLPMHSNALPCPAHRDGPRVSVPQTATYCLVSRMVRVKNKSSHWV